MTHFRRFVAIAQILSLTLTPGSSQVLWAASPGLEPLRDLPMAGGLVARYRPLLEPFGQIQEAFQGSANQMVLLVLDLHCDAKAQKSIYRTLRQIRAREKVPLKIAIEGAKGRVDTSLFSDIEDKKRRQEILEWFLGKGLISGAEYFAAMDEKAAVYGVEDPPLYFENLSAFKASFENRDRVDEILRALSAHLDQSAGRLFPEEYNRYRRVSQTAGFPDQIRFLSSAAADRGITLDAYVQVELFNRVRKLSDRIDPDGIQREQVSAIRALEAKLHQEELKQLVARSLLYRTGRTTQREFLRDLRALCGKAGVPWDQFSNLQRQLEAEEMFSGLDYSGLIREVTALEKRLKEEWVRTAEQKKLESLLERTGTIRDLSMLQLSREAFQAFHERRESFQGKSLWNDLEGLGNARGVNRGELSGLDVLTAPALEFYEKALARDDALYRHAAAGLEKKDASLPVWVVGGFHRDGLSARLKKRGISFISFIPKTDAAQGLDGYWRRMMDGRTALEELKRERQLRLAPLVRLPHEMARPQDVIDTRLAVFWQQLSADPAQGIQWGLENGYGVRVDRPAGELAFNFPDGAASKLSFSDAGALIGQPLEGWLGKVEVLLDHLALERTRKRWREFASHEINNMFGTIPALQLLADQVGASHPEVWSKFHAFLKDKRAATINGLDAMEFEDYVSDRFRLLTTALNAFGETPDEDSVIALNSVLAVIEEEWLQIYELLPRDIRSRNMFFKKFEDAGQLADFFGDARSIVTESISGSLSAETELISLDRMISRLLEKETVRFRLTPPVREGDFPVVMTEAVPRHVRQVITNLIKNAKEAGKQEAALQLKVALVFDENTGHAVFRLSDNGTGMKPEVLQRIFDDAYSTKGGRGRGIGLHLSKRMVEHWGGRIRAQSHEGEGTTFEVSFPTLDIAAPREALAKNISEAGVGNKEINEEIQRAIRKGEVFALSDQNYGALIKLLEEKVEPSAEEYVEVLTIPIEKMSGRAKRGMTRRLQDLKLRARLGLDLMNLVQTLNNHGLSNLGRSRRLMILFNSDDDREGKPSPLAQGRALAHAGFRSQEGQKEKQPGTVYFHWKSLRYVTEKPEYARHFAEVLRHENNDLEAGRHEERAVENWDLIKEFIVAKGTFFKEDIQHILGLLKGKPPMLIPGAQRRIEAPAAVEPQDIIPVRDVLVIGAGPAGLMLSQLLQQLGYTFSVLEKGRIGESWSKMAHFLMVEFKPFDFTGLDVYPRDFMLRGQQEIVDFLNQYAEHFGFRGNILEQRRAEKITPVKVGGETVWEVLSRMEGSERGVMDYARSVVVATGIFHQPRKLGVPGEDDFPDRIFRIVKDSEFKTPKGHWEDKEIVIVGGGNTALLVALSLRSKVKKVTIVMPEETIRWSDKTGIPTDPDPIYRDGKKRDGRDGIQSWLESPGADDAELALATGARVSRFTSDQVFLKSERDGSEIAVPYHASYLCTGFSPALDFLQAQGIGIAGGKVQMDPTTMQALDAAGQMMRGFFLMGIDPVTRGGISIRMMKSQAQAIAGLIMLQQQLARLEREAAVLGKSEPPKAHRAGMDGFPEERIDTVIRTEVGVTPDSRTSSDPDAVTVVYGRQRMLEGDVKLKRRPDGSVQSAFVEFDRHKNTRAILKLLDSEIDFVRARFSAQLNKYDEAGQDELRRDYEKFRRDYARAHPDEPAIEAPETMDARSFLHYLNHRIKTAGVVVLNRLEFLEFVDRDNHWDLHSGTRRNAVYMPGGIYEMIKDRPKALAAALADEALDGILGGHSHLSDRITQILAGDELDQQIRALVDMLNQVAAREGPRAFIMLLGKLRNQGLADWLITNLSSRDMIRVLRELELQLGDLYEQAIHLAEIQERLQDEKKEADLKSNIRRFRDLRRRVESLWGVDRSLPPPGAKAYELKGSALEWLTGEIMERQGSVALISGPSGAGTRTFARELASQVKSRDPDAIVEIIREEHYDPVANADVPEAKAYNPEAYYIVEGTVSRNELIEVFSTHAVADVPDGVDVISAGLYASPGAQEGEASAIAYDGWYFGEDFSAYDRMVIPEEAGPEALARLQAHGYPLRPGHEDYPLRAGTMIGGKYEVVRYIGGGGVGEVWEARAISDVTLGDGRVLKRGTPMVLKITRSRNVQVMERVSRWMRKEAQFLRSISGGVPELYDYGWLAPHGYFLAMENRGKSLIEAGVAVPSGSGDALQALEQLTPRRILEVKALVRKILQSLASVHAAGILHRDIKRANVVYDEERETAALIDFTHSMRLADQDALMKYTGTPGFIAPETILGEREDFSTDLFLTGVLLFDILTGLAPFPLHVDWSALEDDAWLRAWESTIVNLDHPRRYAGNWGSLLNTITRDPLGAISAKVEQRAHFGPMVRFLRMLLYNSIVRKKEDPMRYGRPAGQPGAALLKKGVVDRRLKDTSEALGRLERVFVPLTVNARNYRLYDFLGEDPQDGYELYAASRDGRSMMVRVKEGGAVVEEVKPLVVDVRDDYDAMSRAAADQIKAVVAAKANARLLLPTGNTPVGMYRELAGMAGRGETDLSNVTIFMLDEYKGGRDYFEYIHKNFLDLLPADHRPKAVHVLNGLAGDVQSETAQYETMIRKEGGIDLAVLGIGVEGHIGFNESGSKLSSRTRVVDLAPSTIEANAEAQEKGYTQALTAGISTILNARKVVLLANGPKKTPVIGDLWESLPGDHLPATWLKAHSDTTVLVDRDAAALLPDVLKTPRWNVDLVRGVTDGFQDLRADAALVSKAVSLILKDSASESTWKLLVESALEGLPKEGTLPDDIAAMKERREASDLLIKLREPGAWKRFLAAFFIQELMRKGTLDHVFEQPWASDLSGEEKRGLADFSQQVRSLLSAERVLAALSSADGRAGALAQEWQGLLDRAAQARFTDEVEFMDVFDQGRDLLERTKGEGMIQPVQQAFRLIHAGTPLRQNTVSNILGMTLNDADYIAKLSGAYALVNPFWNEFRNAERSILLLYPKNLGSTLTDERAATRLVDQAA